MSTKTCTACQQTLPLNQFAPRSGSPGKTLAHCHNCKRARQRAAYQTDPKRRAQIRASDTARTASNAAFVDNYLRAHPCVDCGETNITVLEFDHVRGEKHANLADMVRRGASQQRIQDEIAKCEVRCVNCHRRVTASRANWRTAPQNTRSEEPS